MSVLTGTLRADGRALGGQDVLAFDPAGPDLLATGVTDDRGEFRLDVGDAAEAAVLAKVRGEVTGLAAATAPLHADGPLELDAGATFHTVVARIEAEPGLLPDRLDVFLDPVQVQGVPDDLVPFARQKAEGVFEGHYMQRSAEGQELTLRVAPGRWKLGGSRVDYERGSWTAPEHRNVVVQGVRTDAGELDGSWPSGFALDVRGDLRVVLVLRELADDEL